MRIADCPVVAFCGEPFGEVDVSKVSAFLLDYHDDPAEELYDIENDPFEKNNLATSHEQAGKLAELRELDDKRMK